MTRPANRPSPAGTTSAQAPTAGPRRWPDLLIGLLVLLLLGGFGALLLKPQRAASTATVPANPSNIPAAPTQATTPGAGTPANSDQGQGVNSGSAATPNSSASGNSSTSTPPNAGQEPPTIAATPVQAQPTTPPATSVKPPSAADTQGTSQQTASEAPTTTAPSAPAAPRSGGAVATSASRVPLRSDYRISLGVFQTAKTVSTQTAAVTGLGYTVYPINVSNGFVAQVGPFADEATALQALADIQRAYPAARMYRPKGMTGPATSTAATSDTGATGPSSSAAPANTAAPAASSGLTYLQVGAFDKVETAQRLVERLRTLGYSPTVNAPAGRKVTVWVGPFSGGALGRTEDRLTQNGLDHFRVQ